MTTDEDRAIILTIVGVAATVIGIRALGKARKVRQPQGKVIDTTAEWKSSPAATGPIFLPALTTQQISDRAKKAAQ